MLLPSARLRDDPCSISETLWNTADDRFLSPNNFHDPVIKVFVSDLFAMVTRFPDAGCRVEIAVAATSCESWYPVAKKTSVPAVGFMNILSGQAWFSSK